MAGDWIKVRTNLGGDPAVKSMARELRETVHAVVGRLHALWSWADQHTDDGALDFTVLTDIDDIVEKRGFAAQMIRVGWLIDRGADGVLIPNWERHNGKSAKKRCLDSEAQRRKRETNSDKNRNTSENNSDKKRRTPDQRREENIDTPIVPKGDERAAGFEEFWNAYPRKVNKPRALRAWRSTAEARPDTASLLAAIDAFRNSAAWAGDESQFIPHPASWLNGHRWDEVLDGSEKSKKKETGGPPDELWRAALEALYPEADPQIYRSWGDVPDSLREEIHAAIAAAEKEAA